MSNDSDRDQITAWFRELRRHEEGATPPFDRLWAGARSQVPTSRHRRFYYRLGFAAALLVLLAVPLLWWQQRNRAPAVTTVQMASISQWKSPTAFLVETPGQKMLKTVPRFGVGFMDMRALRPQETR